jgi:hypothetical protein
VLPFHAVAEADLDYVSLIADLPSSENSFQLSLKR